MDELCELVTDGTHDSPKPQKEGVPFIKGRNISGGTVDFSACDFITLKDHEEACRRVKPQRGDILFSNIGSVGDTAVVKDDREFSIKNVALFRPDQLKVDRAYFYYLVLSPEFRSKVMNVRSGSAQPFISLANLRSFEVSYIEDGNIQRRIAGILSAYDELIENSQRRIKILESMARALYREWFIHFRFPGHESVPRVSSPLGEIPQGWAVQSLFALTKVNYGKNLPTKKLADDGDYPVYGAVKIIGRYTQYTREQRTIICGCRGSVGEMQITQPKCYVTNNSFTFDPTHPDSFFWLFHTLKERGLRDVVGGAAQPKIKLDGISSVELVTPPLAIRRYFQRTVTSIFEQAWTLDSQIYNLFRTRDLLLPRLLTGEIDVEAMPS